MGLTTWTSPNGQKFQIDEGAVPLAEPFFKRLHELHPGYQSLGGYADRPMRTLDGRNLGGKSTHAGGYTMDIKAPDEVLRQLAGEFPQYRWGGNFKSHYDPVHFEFGPGSTSGGHQHQAQPQGQQSMAGPYDDPRLMQQAQTQQPQGLSGLVAGITQNPLFLMGASVLGSQNVGQGLMAGAQAANSMEAQRIAQQRQMTQDARQAELFPLQKQMLAAQVQKAGEPPTTNDIREFEYAKRNGFNGGFQDWLTKKKEMSGQLGNTPIMGVDPNGNTAVMRLGPNGLTVANMPAGYSVDPKGAIKIDTADGTKIATQGGRVVGDFKKNIADKETAEELGKARGKFQASLPKLEMNVAALAQQNDLAKEEIKGALGDIAQGGVAGWNGATAKYLPGTAAYRLSQRITTLKAMVGLDKLGELKDQSATGASGLGALSENEMVLLTSVFGSLDQKQDAATLAANLSRLERLLDGRKERFIDAFEKDKARFGMMQPMVPAGGQQPQQQPQPQTGGAGAFAAPAMRQAPPAAVQMLRSSPSPQSKAQFDEIFGQGAADRALGGQ